MSCFQVKREPIARKDYHCEASEWIDDSDLEYMSDEDIKIVKKAEAEGYKILKGTKYVKVVGRYCGEFYVFRARPDLDAICDKYDLYPPF